MGIDEWTYHSTYRGIDILVYTSSQTNITTYGAYTDRWVLSTSKAAVKKAIDVYLGPEEPPEPELKPTNLTLSVYPTTGTPPYEVTITATLTSRGVGVQYKTIICYRDDVIFGVGGTDSNGKAVFQDIVTDKTSYYAVFEGDDEYEGCNTKAAGLGGLGLLLLLWLIMEAMS